MRNVYIAGAGMTKFTLHPELSVKQLGAMAINEALQDAGLEQRCIEAAFVANTSQGALEGQHTVRGQIILRAMGITGIPVVNLENACAAGSTALHMAVNQIRSGAADIVLALGVEKMAVGDKANTMALFESGWDVHTKSENVMALAGGYFDGAEIMSGTQRRSMFMDLYCMMARHHMEKFGTSQHQMALVAEKNHFHSTFNPKAQYQKPFTVEQILAAPLVSGPLTVPMCAPVSDGAAAMILVSESALKRLGSTRAIKVEAAVMRTGTDRDARDYENHVCRLAALAAYEQAGIGPADIDVAEVHDAAAFGEILQTECLGFCDIGAGGALVESGATRLGGRIPVNPSGGLLSKGHPIAATGLGQIAELVMQLRGEAGPRQVPGARFAIAENGGALIGVEEAVTCVTILGKL